MDVNFRKLFYSKSGIIITSIIWGLGLAALFRRVCKDRSCIVMKAPNPDWMKRQVMKEKEDCYQMIPENSQCDEYEE